MTNETKQTFYGKVKDNKLSLYDKLGLVAWLTRLNGKEVVVSIEKDVNKRTRKQNNALHVYFELVAEELEAAGIDARVFFKPEIPITVTPEMIKDMAWRTIQKALLKKDSTTQLTTTEVNKVYELFDRHLGEKFHIHVEFPHIAEDGDNPFTS